MIKTAPFVLFLAFVFISQAFSLPPCFPPFQHNTDYNTGNRVSHLGRNYQANWGTREVPGLTNWGGWRLLGDCGHETIVDLTEKRSPELIESISQFLLFASENLLLNSGVAIAGNIGANGNVLVGDMATGWNTRVNGNIYTKGKVKTIADVVINGNIFANGGLELGWNARHDGELITNHIFNFTVPRKTIPASSNDINGAWRQNVVLPPGNYRNVSVSDGGNLHLSAGIYNLNILSMNSNNLNIHLNLSPGENIQLNVQDSIQFGSGARIVFSGETAPLSFKIYTNQTKNLIIPVNSEINAIITAPNAKVIVNSSARFNGAIYAREIEVKAGAVINSVPKLTDIFHSNFNFAPNFDENTTDYFSVIPFETNIEFVEAIAPSQYIVKEIERGERHIFKVSDTVSGLVSYYKLEFIRSLNNSIFVHPATNGNGSSWASPMNCLQRAIDSAKTTGRRILVAEGNYGNIVVRQGTKIIGGFEGHEMDGEPQGDAYDVIISGNNNTQAIVINGFENAKSVKIKGFTIQDGRSETNGAGIHSRNVIPRFEKIIVQNNTAKENGAGIFAPRGVQDLRMVLVENNTGKSAFYLGGNDRDSTKAERLIVYRNSGIGLDVGTANISLANSIFYGNKTAISTTNSKLEIIHCTFAKNDTGVVSKNSNVKIVNTILWNENKELVGNGFGVSFSCVKGGFAGEGNIDDDPLFVDIENPKGEDGYFGTDDDGLMLKRNSPCIDAGKDVEIKDDLAETPRPLGTEVDIGAYEISIPPDMPQVGFGILNLDGVFITGEGIGDFAVQASSKRDLYKLLFSRSALTLRFYHPRNRDSHGIDSGYTHVFFEKNNSVVGGQKLQIKFYRHGVDANNSNYIYTTRKFDARNRRFIGKPIFLVAETDTAKLRLLRDERYHILPVDTGAVRLRTEIFTRQFR